MHPAEEAPAPVSAVVELLLPAAERRRRRLAESCVETLRELARAAGASAERAAEPERARDAARDAGSQVAPSRVESAEPALRAAEAIGALEREALNGALGALLGAHLAQLFPASSFQSAAVAEEPRASADPTAAWSAVAAAQAGLGPRAGEPARETVLRLLDARVAEALGAPRTELWRARLTWAVDGPAAGESAHRVLLAKRAFQADAGARCEAARAVAESLLDRGQVRAARTFLDQELELCALDPELARLIGWCELLLGDERAARELLAGLPPPEAGLPAALAELRADCPHWSALLAGVVRAGHHRPPAVDRGRTDLGAVALAVVAWESGPEARAVFLECAPGLRDRAAEWMRERLAAVAESGEAEQVALRTGREVRWHAAGCDAGAALAGCAGLHGALSPQTRALALVPLRAADGAWRGFVRLESEHHLLPSTARLTAFGSRVLDSERSAGVPDEASGATAGALAGAPWPVPRRSAEPRDAFACAVEGLVAALELRLESRRWWGFEISASGEPESRASGGGALDDWRERRGGLSAVRRALASRCAVLECNPRPADGVHAGSAAVLAVPLAWAGRPFGALALESTRRNGLRAEDAARLEGAVARAAAELYLASFRRWHARERREELHLSVATERERATWQARVHAAADREPLLVVGPPGSGKSVLARFLHFAAAFPAHPGELTSLRRAAERGFAPAREAGARAPSAAALEFPSAGGGTVVAEEIDCWPVADQRRLAEWLDEDGARPPRLVCTLTRAAEESARSAAEFARGLDEQLARRLGGRVLAVHALSERRGEIPGLARVFAARAAAAGGRGGVRELEASFDDEALAFLWRQDWPGNVRELRAFVARAVSRGAPPSAADLEAQLAADGANVRVRLDPRRASAALVEQALASTRKRCGSWNKTRAALYLGWDPDTLCARLAPRAVGGGAPKHPGDPGDPGNPGAGRHGG